MLNLNCFVPKGSKINLCTVQFTQINWQKESTDIDIEAKVRVLLALTETAWTIQRTNTWLEQQAGLLNTFILGTWFCFFFFFPDA